MNGTPLPVAPLSALPRRQQFSRLTTLIAAMLVIGALVGTSLLVFQVRPPATATPSPLASPSGPVGQPVAVQTQAHGLVATLRLTPGPYFLSELVEVHLSLTNHSRNAYHMTWQPEKSCASAFPGEIPMTMTGGEGASDPTLQHNLAPFTCGGATSIFQDELDPTKTLSYSEEIALTTSGHITLTPQVRLEKIEAVAKNVYVFLQNSDPLAGQWPSVQITVQAAIPSDRFITGRQRGTQVTVTAPPLARSQLIYAHLIRCQSSAGAGQMKLNTLTLQRPTCAGYDPGKFVEWIYAVGAPGYAVFSGSLNG